MNTFRHNGKHGDMIYALPTIRALGGGVLYLPEDTQDDVKGMYSNLKPLLEQQPYITAVKEYPSNLPYMVLDPFTPVTYDLDRARLERAKGVKHIIRWYMDAFGVRVSNWKEPWLTVEGAAPRGEYTVINYTGRHITNKQTGCTSTVDWKKVIAGIEGRKVFVGLPREYECFCSSVAHLDYIHTSDALQLAQVIKGAKAVYCNQSFVLTIAQGMGVGYYLDAKPGKTNTIMNVPNEHILT